VSSPLFNLVIFRRRITIDQLKLPPFHLVLPGLMVAGAMSLPLLYLLLRTVTASASAWEQLVQANTIRILGNSILLAATVTLASNLIAIPMAWLTARTDLPGRRIWAIVTVLPLVMPSYVGSYAITALLGPRGMLQQTLAEPLGITRIPDLYGFPGAWLTLTLFAYPYVLLNVRAALMGLDRSQEEAARSLGDSAWSVFRRITLPQLRPSIAAGSLLIALYVLSDFGAVSMMRFSTFTRAIYVQYSSSFDRSQAAVLALLLVVLTGVLLAVETRVQGRVRSFVRPTGSRRLVLSNLGRWRWPAFLYCVLITLISLGLPLIVIVYWLVRGIQAGEPVELWLGPAWRSMIASGLAALLALLGALPVALMVVRYPGRFSMVVERASYIGYALPGIVIALALVFVGANFATPLYQTLAMLVFAYVVRFMPQAVGALRSTVAQISPRIDEAAHGLGARTARVLFSVTIPLVRPGLISGGALVFLTSMKELPSTLLLAPTGYDTLATRVWSATTGAMYARAAAPALLLLLVSALSLGFMLARETDIR
jgi:iron(III) transport system permease protein